MSALRQVLAEVRSAEGTTDFDVIAARVGVSRDEVAAMVDFWVRRGDIVAQEIATCPPGGCGGCSHGSPGTACPTARPGGPVLVALTPRLPASR